jgi:hypothetical protein
MHPTQLPLQLVVQQAQHQHRLLQKLHAMQHWLRMTVLMIATWEQRQAILALTTTAMLWLLALCISTALTVQ